jgi:four helix bundle protein
MRDHRKLQAFALADGLAIAVYRETQAFSKAELFGQTSQMRRAAVSICSNIVEGCARPTEIEHIRFLDIAFGSSQEPAHQVSLAARLGYMPASNPLIAGCAEVGRVLNGLICALCATREKNLESRAWGLEPIL